MVEPRSEWVVGSPCRLCDDVLTRFLELAGCTPSELLAEDLPSFQDEAASEASSSLS